SASCSAARMRSALPSRSPTRVSICASAIRRWGIPPAYGLRLVDPASLLRGTIAGVQPLPGPVAELADRSADPPAVRFALDRVDPPALERLGASPDLAEAFVAVTAASPSLARRLQADPGAPEAPAHLAL